MPVLAFLRHTQPGLVDARAAALGISRGAYLRSLVDADLRRPLKVRSSTRFDDLCGSLAVGHGSDNRSVRARLAAAGGKACR